jgi:RsiW-degrading membrane proteinase PrsW (M82 family)
MIWLLLYFIIAFAIFIGLLCLCCIEYKKIDNPYLSFKYWMFREDNWCIILYSIFWGITLPFSIVLKIALFIVNLVLKHFDIEPIRLCS